MNVTGESPVQGMSAAEAEARHNSWKTVINRAVPYAGAGNGGAAAAGMSAALILIYFI